MSRGSSAGLLAMLPTALLLLCGFALPLGFIAWTSLMPPRTFALDSPPDPRQLRDHGDATATGARSSGRSAWRSHDHGCLRADRLADRQGAGAPGAVASRSIVSVLIAVPIFIAESVRLFGAYLFLMPRGGILAGTLGALFGLDVGSVL